MIKVIIAAAVAFFMCLFSEAGVVITGAADDGVAQNIYVSGDSLRLDMVREGVEESRAIFRRSADGGRMTVADVSEGVYYEITSGDLESMTDMLTRAREMMEQALSSMPEEQREQVRRMMEQQLEGMQVERKVVLEESGVRVNGWTCDRYAVNVGGRKRGVVFFAGARQFGLTAEDLRVLVDFEKFWEPVMSMDESSGAFMFSAAGEPGIPVRVTELEEGVGEVEVFRVTEVKKQPLPADFFKVPGGLRRVENPFSGE